MQGVLKSGIILSCGANTRVYTQGDLHPGGEGRGLKHGILLYSSNSRNELIIEVIKALLY